MGRITFMLPQDLKARAMRRAGTQGISLGELLREALTTALSEPDINDKAGDRHFADAGFEVWSQPIS